MAFRGYELNLMLRVQDRASSRLRRVASDIGGVNRAAQLQRKASVLQKAQGDNLVKTATLRNQLDSHTNRLGSDYLNTQQRLKTLKATEIGQAAKLKQAGIDLNRIQQIGFNGRRAWAQLEGGKIVSLSEKQAQLALRGLSTQEKMIQLRTVES